MRIWEWVLASASVTFVASAVGCTAGVSEESKVGEWQTDQVTNELSVVATATIEYVLGLDNDGRVSARCPSDNPYALGGGHTTVDGGMRVARPHVSSGNSVGIKTWSDASSNSGRVSAQAVCSIARPEMVIKEDSDGDATAYCPTGQIAVGGGGHCYGDGVLRRSRPHPDNDEATPSAWRATCTSGKVKAYVNCRTPLANFNFTGCNVERKDDNDENVHVSCDSGSNIVAAGAWCGGSGKHIVYADVDPDLKGGTMACSGSNIHGYAICCSGLEVKN